MVFKRSWPDKLVYLFMAVMTVVLFWAFWSVEFHWGNLVVLILIGLFFPGSVAGLLTPIAKVTGDRVILFPFATQLALFRLGSTCLSKGDIAKIEVDSDVFTPKVIFTLGNRSQAHQLLPTWQERRTEEYFQFLERVLGIAVSRASAPTA